MGYDRESDRTRTSRAGAARRRHRAACVPRLARLPEEQRRAIVLAGLLGYTAREVGEIEDIPLGTAKTRIRTALQRLRVGAGHRGAC